MEYITYICIINGIRGFRYWADFPKAPSSFKTMIRLFAEIRQLQAPLISLDNTPEFNCNSDKIKFTIKKDDNYIYLISVNETRDPVTARFDLSSVLKNGSAEVLFENRNAIIDNSVLHDTWQGLQRHVYRFRQ